MSRQTCRTTIRTSVWLAVLALALTVGAARAQDDKTAEEVFHNHISGPVVQAKCINCHVANGMSGHTRLVFVRSSDAIDHEARNLRTLQNLLDDLADEGGGTYILNKIQGVAHGGGVQVPLGSTDFANMERFLGLLGEQIATAVLTPATLFDTVIMASPRKTLRRAALIFAGRIPTEAEYAAVEGGDESVLRATIRGLMAGPQFHEFLIRGSNDRLLTDRDWRVIDADGYFVDMTNLRHQKLVAESQGRPEGELDTWYNRVQFGFRRAPLELIAYVVENDLPYTEILTADYIMANPMAAEAYGASTVFADPNDPFEFRQSEIVSYYRDDESKVLESSQEFGIKVIDPGDLWTIYPHAGILNTTVFLLRYPSTATNRNRARARWTYYHFLGVDVEKSASRTTDPVALADTHNPTMHNPACTVCHSVLDPVAGAFQNYGDDGFYRDQWGGLDSLDGFYKYGDEHGHGWVTAKETFEITAVSREEAHTLTVTAMLNAGTEVLHLDTRFDPPLPDGSRFLWHLGIDHVAVLDADGVVVRHLELQEEASHQPREGLEVHEMDLCGFDPEDQPDDYYVTLTCGQTVHLEIPEDGIYDVEVVVWTDAQDGISERRGLLDLSLGGYVEGDTWYRDMRFPGFAGAASPHPDNSVQWLARQIVADPRFAEATVKFWWPAIMGSEIAEFPEEAADADFEGLLLAASAQDAEVVRLASGFRDGFPGSPYTYNLKDLLVEIVMSKWFRADALTDTDPVRRVALRNAGAWRLLTPEELARKTAAVTGYQWGRRRSRPWAVSKLDRWRNALTDEYRLFYGGIDSGGITERARDITSVMAGVAERHAAEVSCPVVMRELYLLPDADRRLFAGIDPYVTPVSEFSTSFKIEGESWDERETFSLSGPLTSGTKHVKLSLIKDTRGQKLRLDRLRVRNASGEVVASREIKDVEWSGGDCGRSFNDNFSLYCDGIPVTVQVEIPAKGNYAIEIVAWGNRTGVELPEMGVTVESNSEDSAGSAVIRNKLVELHDKLLGIRVTPDSLDVEAAYQLYVDVWEHRRESQVNWFEHWLCDWRYDLYFLEGILDGAVVERDVNGYLFHEIDRDRAYAFLEGVDISDRHHTAQTWVVVLAAMLMDYRYLYLH